MKFKDESIEKLKEQVSRLSLSQVDGTSDEPGATDPVQGSARGAGTSTGAELDPSRVRTMNANTIMERTVLAGVPGGAGVMTVIIASGILPPRQQPRQRLWLK